MIPNDVLLHSDPCLSQVSSERHHPATDDLGADTEIHSQTLGGARGTPRKRGGSIVGTRGVKNTTDYGPHNQLSKVHGTEVTIMDSVWVLARSSVYTLWLCSVVSFWDS